MPKFRCYILNSWLYRDQCLAPWQLERPEASTTLWSFKATPSARTSSSHPLGRLLCWTAKGGWTGTAPVPAWFMAASWKTTQRAAANREPDLCGWRIRRIPGVAVTALTLPSSPQWQEEQVQPLEFRVWLSFPVPSLPSPLHFLCSAALALTWHCSAGGSNSNFSYSRNLQLPLYF